MQHCPNNEDESDCILRECSKDKFKCNDGKCIARVWVCDGKPQILIIFYFFLSLNCLHTISVSGDKDCATNEDEMNCEVRNCSENEFR